MQWIVLIFSLVSYSAWADSFYVADTTSVNVDKADAAAITEIIKATVTEIGGHKIENDRNTKLHLRSKVIKLGTAYVLTIEKTESGNVVYSQNLKAQQLEEMDLIAARLTRAVIEQKPVKDNVKVGEVSETDKVVGTKRREAVKRWDISLGTASHSNVNAGDTKFNFTIGYEWEIPSSSAAIEILWDGSANVSFFGLGGKYFFNDGDTSPVLLANVGYGSVNIENNGILTIVDDSGFGISAGGGVRFFRTSSMNLQAIVDYTLLFVDAVGGEKPSKLSFKVGIFF